MSHSTKRARLSQLRPGMRAQVLSVLSDEPERVDRLAALGVTPGASVDVLQTFPGIIFRCDQTELAVEPAVAGSILVELADEA